jgi:hypothetical protein
MRGPVLVGTLAFGHHEDRTPTHGYEATREAAMAAFAKSWRRRILPKSGRARSRGDDAITQLVGKVSVESPV